MMNTTNFQKSGEGEIVKVENFFDKIQERERNTEEKNKNSEEKTLLPNTLTVTINKNDLICCVCQEVMYRAKCMTCLHRLCDTCVYLVDCCPLCREINGSVRDDPFLSNIAQNSIPFELKCGSVCHFENADDHINNCMKCMRYYLKESKKTIIQIKEQKQKLVFVYNENNLESESESED